MPAQPNDEVLDAARTALANWLAARLAAAYPTLVVMDDWPDPNQPLPPYAVTVLAAGDPDYFYLPPTVTSVVPTTGNLADVTYLYGWIDGLPLQLDVFASSKVGRDALMRDVRKQLNLAPQISLAGSAHDPGGLADYSVKAGLVLELPDLFSSLCYYEFEPTAPPIESSTVAEINEWRATFKGDATLALMTRESMALLKLLKLSDTTGGTAAEVTVVVAPTP